MAKTSKKKDANATSGKQKTLTLEDVLSHIVDVRPELGRKIIRFILDAPEETIPDICRRIHAGNDEKAMQALYALNGIVMYVMEAGQEELRSRVAYELALALGNKQLTDYAKCMIIQHLQLLKEPMTLGALVLMLDGNEPVSSYAVAAIQAFVKDTELNEGIVTLLVTQLKKHKGDVKLKLAYLLAEFDQFAELGDVLRKLEGKKVGKLNDMELALVALLASRGMADFASQLLDMLRQDSLKLQGQARRSLGHLVHFFAEKARAEGGFENYIRKLEEEDDCCCEDDECDEDDGDCGDPECHCHHHGDGEHECHCHHHGDGEHECHCHQEEYDEKDAPCHQGQVDFVDELEWDEGLDDEGYACDEDYDFQACVLAKEFFASEPGAPSLHALIDAYGCSRTTLPLVSAALAHPDPVMSQYAVGLLKHSYEGTHFSEELLNEAMTIELPEVKALLIDILACRGDLIGKNFIMSCLYDKETVVREAACKAVEKTLGQAVDTRQLQQLVNGKTAKTKATR